MSSGFKPLMPLDEAWQRLRQQVLAHGSSAAHRLESVPSVQALGRVLAQTLVSGVDVPPLDNSAMDGYALRSADLSGPGGMLPQSQRIAAGSVGQSLEPGTCARIFTGAPVPVGADAVVMQEHARPEAGGIVFEQAVQAGQNIRLRGEDIARGSTVLSAGTVLTPAALGVAASIGAAQVEVHARPRVAVLTTGNELVMPGQPLPPGAIYNSNRHALTALVQAAGGVAGDMGIVPDELQATRATLVRAAEHHDLIISSGGVSVGEEDHLKAAVEAEGALDFWALAIKPGKPFVSGHIRRADGSVCLYLGLPGNPSASFVTFLLLVRPVLSVLAGLPWALPRALVLPAAFDWPRPDRRREFLRARLGDDGQVGLYGNQGSGVMASAAWADGLVDLAPGQIVRAGEPVHYLSMDECLMPAVLRRQG